jgi:hypothetical protein
MTFNWHIFGLIRRSAAVAASVLWLNKTIELAATAGITSK